MTHDPPNGRPGQTSDGRRTIIVLLAVIASFSLIALIVVLASGSNGDRPDVTGDSGDTETTRTYIFMAETEGALSKLNMTIGPDGQITGEHLFVRWGDNGKPYYDDPEPFGGTFTDGYFELTGLSSNGKIYTGTLEGDTLILNGTFGPSTQEWTLIGSDAEFDEAVENHTPPPYECEDEGPFGCGEY
ncbi:hypothetical protein FB566_3540 [Stackebrandtia endophytica]|uniref:Uncharacterized protein n=1 Tax=Stackebrandtia endophytica TaxID=1496996 RepID=A0A543AZE4_9ACTN|nr:hypothetical protein [Stackebrandtia endophytica]TQL77965.1 hypothetical protein FB566_3540 [Stackebrandtia endophytica]